MNKPSKAYIIVRADHYLFLLSILAAGVMYAVLDLPLFMWLAIGFAVAVFITLLRDWKTPWVVFTYEEAEGEFKEQGYKGEV